MIKHKQISKHSQIIIWELRDNFFNIIDYFLYFNIIHSLKPFPVYFIGSKLFYDIY